MIKHFLLPPILFFMLALVVHSTRADQNLPTNISYDNTILNTDTTPHISTPLPTVSIRDIWKWIDDKEDTVPRTETTLSRITQTEDEHVKQGNGSMFAVDYVSSDWNAYFPEEHNEYIIHHIGFDERLGNYIIIRNDKTKWVFWHTVTSRKEGEYVNTKVDGNVLWQNDSSGLATAPHTHIEIWRCLNRESMIRDCDNVSSQWQVAPRNKELKEQRWWVSVHKEAAKADKEVGWESKKESIKLTDKVIVIKCLNEKTMTLHEPNKWTCFLGKGWRWKNIMLPPQSHIDTFKKVFGDDYKYRLAIANFEGSFREDAENTYAIWYLQTLKSHKVKPDITSQLEWLKNREVKTTGRICDLNGWNKTKIERYSCMAAGHFGFFKPWDKHYAHSVMYKKRYKTVTEYYLSLNF